ncbi:MAG: HD domain-containing protein [Armatimonadetes bacterium]|nr:HD domain-containing protein [Armatimonadota bacterium]
MNVSSWRDEPAPPPSPLAARLLRWMSEATPAPQELPDEVAQRLAAAILELCEADAVALWACPDAANRLHLWGRAGDFDGDFQAADVDFAPEAWPQSLFFIVQGEGQERDLAVTLGLISEKNAAPSLCVPLDERGIALLWLQSEDGELSDDWKAVFEMAGLQAGAILSMATRAERLNRSFRQFAEILATAVDSRETGREGYATAVAYYAGLMARTMNLDEAEAQKIEFAALLHGLGRLSIPEAILERKAQLSDEELERVRASTVAGAGWIASVDGLEEVALLVRHQGENYDGSGAPAGLSGDEIPLGSRILAVAARFAAMTARRADRAPLSVVGGAMDSVAENSGAALDPRVVAAFLSAMGRSVS